MAQFLTVPFHPSSVTSEMESPRVSGIKSGLTDYGEQDNTPGDDSKKITIIFHNILLARYHDLQNMKKVLPL